ncbi:hypothetical protein RO3G_16497 [Rhizopus delemar RA 99-880]|uniref:Uncharacterized protein n=1 Tax=Rhizopus delemar (strain RA 99-880 / ATCC MYA-4621 / FGSC 9543 / NRRL 43880) TaxID=246409 RepID=I1CTK6_RHIO9|nr:hypothetical protein RO3G_16497 [Rhizopus delemar RA 99-880]|eukprot:EIE91786.1 hypothetical protein RO3G_16497 [Rhizopus delemar RA 99-880]
MTVFLRVLLFLNTSFDGSDLIFNFLIPLPLTFPFTFFALFPKGLLLSCSFFD